MNIFDIDSVEATLNNMFDDLPEVACCWQDLVRLYIREDDVYEFVIDTIGNKKEEEMSFFRMTKYSFYTAFEKIMKMDNKSYWHKRILNSVIKDDYDAETVDMLCQYALFGDLIYC